MSQNLRVALWVPNVDPAAIGNAVLTSGNPTANKRIPSAFGAAGGGSGGGTVDFATDAEVAAGVIQNEAINPQTLRTEMSREFAILAADFSGAIAITASSGVASANRLVKTNLGGVLDPTLVMLDGGTF
jgi:hypothetical protein